MVTCLATAVHIIVCVSRPKGIVHLSQLPLLDHQILSKEAIVVCEVVGVLSSGEPEGWQVRWR